MTNLSELMDDASKYTSKMRRKVSNDGAVASMGGSSGEAWR
jgi:hypothetical protein